MLSNGSLQTVTPFSSTEIANILTRGLSQATTNIIFQLFGILRSGITLPDVSKSDHNVNIQSFGVRSTIKQQNNSYQLNEFLAHFLQLEILRASIQEPGEPSTSTSTQQNVEAADQSEVCFSQTSWENSSLDFSDPSIDF